MLSIRKSSVPKRIRKQFTEILENDILKSEKINLKSIIDKYDAIGDQISKSLQDGKTEYLLPKNLEIIENYKTPERIEAVRATILWNALEPENVIVPPEKINIIKLRPELAECLKSLNSLDDLSYLMTQESTPKEMKDFYSKYPAKVKALAKTLYNIDNKNKSAVDISNFGLSCIAIPKSENSIPEYLIPFIDYDGMVNNNMTNGYILLESLGIMVEEIKTTKYKSNIIQI